jgi:hypothetical protein
MHRLTSAGIGAAALLAGLVQPVCAADQYRVREVEIIDQNGLDRPVVASRILIPYDWQTRGGVTWNPLATCRGDAVRVDWEASDRSGAYALHIMPSFMWEANNLGAAYQVQGGCQTFTMANAEQYLEAFVNYYRRGARILDYRLRTDLMQALPPLPDVAGMPGYESRTNREVGEILIAVNNNGQEEREVIRATVAVTTTTMSDGLTTATFLNGYAFPAVAMRTPKGALDFRFFDFVTASIRLDPEWERQVTRLFTNIAQVETTEARKRSQIISRTGAEISDMIMQGYEDAQQAQDRQAEAWSQAMRGVELYDDPRLGEQVELPNTYSNAWRLVDGSYVIAADPTFDPGVAFGIDAYRLEPVRPQQ